MEVDPLAPLEAAQALVDNANANVNVSVSVAMPPLGGEAGADASSAPTVGGGPAPAAENTEGEVNGKNSGGDGAGEDEGAVEKPSGVIETPSDGAVEKPSGDGASDQPAQPKDSSGLLLFVPPVEDDSNEDGIQRSEHYAENKLAQLYRKSSLVVGGQWQMMLDRLKEYKRVTGNCDVPRKYPPDQKLATWVQRQRFIFKHQNEKLSKERRQALDAIGFRWCVTSTKSRKDNWNEKFERLVAFKERVGHCRVPYTFKEDPALGFWTSKVRRMRNHNQLDDDKVKMLDLIGFEWNPTNGRPTKKNQVQPPPPSDQQQQQQQGNESGAANTSSPYTGKGQDWSIPFAKLVFFQSQNGHCNVPLSEDPHLALWQQNQRKLYHTHQLAPEQIQKLEKIGYQWDPLEEGWEDNFKKLVAYADAGNDCNTPQDPVLAQWVNNQRLRYKRKRLQQYCINRLEAIGVSWGRLSRVEERKILQDHQAQIETHKEYKRKQMDEISKLQQQRARLRTELAGMREDNFKLSKSVKHRVSKKRRLNAIVTDVKESQAAGAEEKKVLEAKLKQNEEQLKEQAEILKTQAENLQKVLQEFEELNK